MKSNKEKDEMHILIRNIKKISNRFQNNLNKAFEKYDLTSSQGDILFILYKANKNGEIVEQKDIEKKLGLKNPTVTGLLDRLEKKGFVKRTISKEDKRKRIINSTKKANELHENIKKDTLEFRKNAFKNIDIDSIEKAIEVLNKVENNLREWNELNKEDTKL